MCSTRRFLFALGIVPPGYALLETVCRKTGKPRADSRGRRARRRSVLDCGRAWHEGGVRNIKENPRVRVKLRKGFGARWHTGTAHLLWGDDPRERQRWLASELTSSLANSVVVRLFGTDLLTVRIDLDD